MGCFDIKVTLAIYLDSMNQEKKNSKSAEHKLIETNNFML